MGAEHCTHCGTDLPDGVARCRSCAAPTDPSQTMGDGDGALTRIEQFAVVGGLLMAGGTLLPWLSGFGVSVSGLSFDVVPVAVLCAAVFSVLVALPRGRPVLRAATHLVTGLTVSLWGAFLLLGLPAPGLGLFVLLTGGVTVASVGYTEFSRHTSWFRAAAVGCFVTLAINTVLLVALVQWGPR